LQKSYLRGMGLRAHILLPFISGMWLAIGVGIAGTLTPDYSHISQFMSALGSTGAPYAAWTNYAVFVPTEIWFLAFLVILNRRLGASRTRRFALLLLLAYAILLFLAAFLPCDAGCESPGGDQANTTVHMAHMIIAASAYPLALIALLILGLTTRSTSLLRRFALPAAGVGFCLFFAIVLLPEAQGLFQRLLEGWIYLQFLLLGDYVASKDTTAGENRT